MAIASTVKESIDPVAAPVEEDDQHLGDVLVEEAEPKVKQPSLYRVIILNDDYTPMEFVVHVLETFFAKEFEEAYRIMMTIHMLGQGTVGMYPKEIAEMKVEQVNNYSRQHDHPLLTTMEKTNS